jgi:hypothetical protein
MEKIQQEAQNTPEKHHSLPLLFATIFVAVYFLFPVMFAWPVYLVYRTPFDSYPPQVQTVVKTFFYPVNKLRNVIPAYEKLVEREDSLVGMP